METGYIFDLDGVLTDTAEHHFQSWVQLAQENNWQFTREDNEQLRGMLRTQSLHIILNLNHLTLTLKEQERLATRKNELFLDLIRHLGPADLLPGVADLLHDAKAKGIRLGLGSGSKNARDIVERLGILDLLDAIGDGNSVVRGKPAPDLFTWVAGRLDLNPTRCIIFEDGAAGIDAGLAGGFWTVGIGPRERVGKAHLVCSTLAGATSDDFSDIFNITPLA